MLIDWLNLFLCNGNECLIKFPTKKKKKKYLGFAEDGVASTPPKNPEIFRWRRLGRGYLQLIENGIECHQSPHLPFAEV